MSVAETSPTTTTKVAYDCPSRSALTSSKIIFLFSIIQYATFT